ALPLPHAQLVEPLAELLGGQEPPALVEVPGVRRVERARDVAGLGVDRLGLAPVALAQPRIEHRHPAQPAHDLAVYDTASVRLSGGEGAARRRDDVGLHRSGPGLEAAVKHGLVVVAEPAQEEPQPGRHRRADVVVHDHPGAVVDPGLAHRLLELLARRQRVPARPFAGHVLEGDEHRAGDVPCKVLVVAAPALQRPPEVDDAEVVVFEVLGKPAGAHDGTEAHEWRPITRVSWQKCTAPGLRAWTFCSDAVQAPASENCPPQISGSDASAASYTDAV